MAHCLSARWLQFALVIIAGHIATPAYAVASGSAAPQTESSKPGVVFSPESSSLTTEILVAQIIPDTTLGNEQSTISDTHKQTRISGGAIQGANLFHSFEEFNVNTGQHVYFVNPDSIETILSRVTGNNISNIDGLLGVDGAANLFLLNPKGISFGPNAQLDIRGSFTASTAEAVIFADSSTFSAVNPQGASLLTMSVPLGVQFSDHPQGTVSNRGILQTGQDLALAGQNLYLEGQLTAGENLTLQAQDTVTIRDTAAAAFLARSGQNLTIQGNQAIDILTLQHLEQLPFISGEDLVLISDGAISADAHLESGGSIQFLTLNGTPGNFISLYDPIISADGDVILGDYEGAALKIEATGSIQTGEIIITGPDLLLQADGSGSDEDLLASSRAVILRAGVDAIGGNEPPGNIGGTTTPIGTIAGNPIGSIVINGDIGAFNNGGNGGDADNGGPIILNAAGNIDIVGNVVSFAQALPGNGGDAGDGGPIVLTANGDINVDGNFLSFSQALSDSGGNAGNGGPVTLLTTNGNIDVGGIFLSFSQTQENSGGNAGNGGAITLTATGNINIPRDFLSFSGAVVGNAGNGGDISITSTSGDITTSGSLNTISFADPGANNAGNGGDITLSSDAGNISTPGELIAFSTSADGDSGTGGTISIISNSGNILNEGILAANSFSEDDAGPSGNIIIASETGNLLLNGTMRAISISENGNSGPGGNISIASGSGDIIANTVIDSFSYAHSLLNVGNAGDGGIVSISSDSGDITLNKRISSFSSSALGDASNGGDVSILSISGDISTSNIDSSSSLLVQDTPVGITTADTFTRDGGDIFISSTLGNIVIDGFLSSSSFSRDGSVGNGGNISLLTTEGAIRGDGQLSAIAISELDGVTGDGGNITLQANQISDLEISTISSAGASGNVEIRSTADGLTVDDLRLITSGQLEISTPIFFRNIIFPAQPISLDLSDFDQSGKTTIISSNDLTLNNVELLSDANRVADAGNVELRSNGTIQLNNSQIFSDTNPQSSGSGGDIIIVGDNTIVLNNSIITTGTDGSGRAGNILITAPLLTVQNDTQIIGETSSLNRGGIGGDIIVQANGINLSEENTKISVNTRGNAAAGNITLIPLDNRGNLQISTIGEGAQISASTEIGSSGGGGNITIRDADSVLLSNTEILTSGDGSGAAGSIFIQDVGEFVMRRTSLILAAANQTGRGGNVDIDAGFILTIPEEDNDILATANVGQGGTVSITANLINGFREVELFDPSLRGNRISDISARSNFGFDGTVTLESEPNPELTELPTNLTDPANRIAQTCSTEVGAVVDGLTGDFSMTGRGGQLLSPANIAGQYRPLDDLGPAVTEEEAFSTINALPESHSPAAELQAQTSLLDAQEAIVTASGDIFLVTEHRWQPSSPCTPRS